MEVTVKKQYYRESPTKVRPNLYLIKGVKSDKALDTLKLKNNKASRALYQLLLSGVSAAKEKEMDQDKLIVKLATCDQASRLKRHIFKARGRTARITKRLSHLSITLTDSYDLKIDAKGKKGSVDKNDKKPVKKIPTTKNIIALGSRPKASEKEDKSPTKSLSTGHRLRGLDSKSGQAKPKKGTN